MDSEEPSRKKRRYFFKVKTEEDALEAMKIAYQVFYAVAAIQAIILVVVGFVQGPWSTDVLDPVWMVLLALSVHKKQSRTAAVFLAIIALALLILTIGNRFGTHPIATGFAGRNIILAALAAYAAYMGAQGTFRYHTLKKSRVLWGRTFSLTAITFAYAIVVVGMAYAALLISLAEAAWETDESEFLISVSVLLPLIAVVFLGAWRKLPGTRRLNVIAVPD